MEKFSEKEIRTEKIEKLKKKINKEILEYLNKFNQEMKIYLNSEIIDEELWTYLITTEHALIELKRYVNLPSSFNIIEKIDIENDIIIYTIKDSLLNLWLDDSYNFVSRFLNKFEFDEQIKMVYQMLNERYFAYDFTSVFDIVLYKEKNK